MGAALQRAVADLRRRLGDDMHTWKWGTLHRTRPRHPLSRVFPDCAELLNPPQVPAGGDGDTPQQGGSWTPDRFVLTSLSVNRYVHDPADWRRSRWIVPLGASGHPAVALRRPGPPVGRRRNHSAIVGVGRHRGGRRDPPATDAGILSGESHAV